MRWPSASPQPRPALLVVPRAGRTAWARSLGGVTPAAGLHGLGHLVTGCVLSSGDRRVGLGQTLAACTVVEQGKRLEQRLIILEGREVGFHVCERSSFHRPEF